jgi:hypothetical protein
MQDFTEQYNTALPPYEEAKFHAWAHEHDKLLDLEDYDLRGLWKQTGGLMPAGEQHGPDTYKKPNHPTFSDESVYHGVDGHLGGHWTQSGAQSWQFDAGPSNLKHHTPAELEDYFAKYEPGVPLVLPAMKGRR